MCRSRFCAMDAMSFAGLRVGYAASGPLSPTFADSSSLSRKSCSTFYFRQLLKRVRLTVRRYGPACRQMWRGLSNPAISLAGTGRLNK